MTRLPPVQVTPELEAYIESLVPERDRVLGRMEEEIANSAIPAIGPVVGQLLYLVARMSRCRDAIELGTAIGYSTIWLARGCSGRVVGLETHPERAEQARRNLRDAGLSDRVTVIEDDGLAYLAHGDEPVDCVFNDLLNSLPDEAAVERCFELSLRRLRPGGVLIADNALRGGEVTAPTSRGARNVVRHNRLVAREARLESIVVPVRDGVSIARVRD